MGNQQKPISNGNERSIDTAAKEKKKSDKRPREREKKKKNVLCFTVRLDTTHRLGQVHFLARTILREREKFS